MQLTHGGRQAVQLVDLGVHRHHIACRIGTLALERPQEPATVQGRREHVGRGGQHGFIGQIGAGRVDDGDEQHGRMLGAQLAERLEHGAAAGEVGEDRNVASLQFR